MDVIVHAEPIITPYYDVIIKDTNKPFWYNDQNKNYTSYDFFILKTRLTPYVKKHYHIGFDSYRYEGKMQYFVILSTAQTIIPLTKEESNNYQQIVNTILTTYPKHVTLLYLYQEFVTNKLTKSLSPLFVQSVLPYCYQYIIDEQYQPILYDNQLLIKMCDNTYNDLYDQLQNKIINYLHRLYQIGTIVFNTIDNQFINDWQLQSLNFNNHLYTPTWTSPYVNDMTQFLQDQYKHEYVIVDIDESLLNGYDYFKVDHYIFVKFNNVKDLLNL